MDERKSMNVAYLDFWKAFNNVTKRRLGNNVSANGMGANILA